MSEFRDGPPTVVIVKHANPCGVASGDTLVNTANGFQLKTDRHEYYTQRFGLNYQFGSGKSGPLPQTNWNGLYVGGVFGGAVASVRGTGIDVLNAPNSTELGNHGSGFTAGGQVGWNWMIAPKVVVPVHTVRLSPSH